MRWLLHGRTKTRAVRGGQVLEQRCPECGKDARFYEVEVTTSAGAFFVDVLSSTERAFMCGECEKVFDLKDTDDKAALPAGQPPPRAMPAPFDSRCAARNARSG